MRSRVSMLLVALGLTVLIAGQPPTFGAGTDFAELAGDTLFDIVKTLTPNASALREALDRISGDLKLSLPSSMLDPKALEDVDDDIHRLNKLVPAPLPPMNNREFIRKSASGPDHKDTLIGSSEELQRLDKAARSRQREIDTLKASRDELQSLKATYAQTAETARKVSEKVEKLASSPTIEFLSRLNGKDIAMSWVDLATELVPALQEREAAADRAVRRLDRAISVSEIDLKGFNETRSVGIALFSDDPSNGQATGLGASSVPGTTNVTMGQIQRNMIEGTQNAEKLAEDLRKEADEIRTHNANISRYQTMLKVLSLGLSAAPDKPGETSKMIYNKTENTWIINIVPGPNAGPGPQIKPKD